MSQDFLKVGGGQSKGWPACRRQGNEHTQKKNRQQGKLILQLQALTVITEKDRQREGNIQGVSKILWDFCSYIMNFYFNQKTSITI